MLKTAVGIVTFGNLGFTKMTVRSVLETTDLKEEDIVLVVGKPGDSETLNWLTTTNITIAGIHAENMGFPASINDIYDKCFPKYGAVIIMGNDVIAYPHAINSLIKVGEDTDNEWICAREYSVKDLCRDYPEIKRLFIGGNYNFYAFTERPWDKFTNYTAEISTNGAGLSDVHNLSLFKQSILDKVGYIDVNFYPAYYSDNDYCRRAVNAGVKSCSVKNSIYFHFWSRTFKQGGGGSTNKYFDNNRRYYIEKWGGDFGQEKWALPFNGMHSLTIHNRDHELELIRHWRSLG